MIEEFMLLANVMVAKRIYQHNPNIALLRKHLDPKANEIKKLQELLESYGFSFSANTPLELKNSLELI